jgi:tetratricopeptide (TPR) repeat protein
MNDKRIWSILVAWLLLSSFLIAPPSKSQQIELTPDQVAARKQLQAGVLAFKDQHIEAAIENFKSAKSLDPDLLNAQLYLATSYSALYIPGDQTAENIRNGEQALQEFKAILAKRPDNLSALDGAGSILYNAAGNPFDAEKMEESKSFHNKHILLKPDDPEPYYWVGVIDWSLAYRGNRAMRETNRVAYRDPMPSRLAEQFGKRYGDIVEDGMTKLRRAIDLRPNYGDAMAYLNLLYRQKADMQTDPIARADNIKTADDLVDQAKAAMAKNAEAATAPK